MRVGARNTQALAIGSLTSGLLAYVFFVITTRALGATDAAPVSVLWTYWSFAAAALSFPVQHWVARSVAAHDSEGAVRDALPRVAAAVAAAAGVAGLLAWLGRDALFHRDDPWFPLLVATVTLGSGFIGVVRGGLSARHRFSAVAWALIAENALRCLGAVALIVVGTHASVTFGVCLAVGALVGLLWPSSFRFSAGTGGGPVESPFAFLGGAAGGQLIGQAVLTGGPVLLALSGGSAREVTVLFAALALFRAPYTLALGLVSQLTGRLTLLVVGRDFGALRRMRLVVLTATVVVVVAAAVIGALVGPLLMPLIFGEQVQLSRLPALLVSVGSALALANLVTTISIMAQARSHAVVRAWLAASLGAAGLFVALSDTTPLLRTCWVFVAAEAVAFTALMLEELRGSAKLADGATQVRR